MGFNVGAAGAFASGVGRGIDNFQGDQERQQLMAERTQRMTLADAQNTRQMRAYDREDQDRALQQESMADGMKAIEQDRAAYDQAPAPLGLDGKPGTKDPYTPTRKALFRAGQAQQDFLLRKGRVDLATAMDAQLNPMRESLKRDAAKGMLYAMSTGADITGPLGEVDALHNDGMALDGKVTTITQPDGTTAYRFKRKNKFTGETEPERVMSQQQLVQSMATSISKPEEIAKDSQAMLLESLKDANHAKRDAATQASHERIAKGNNEATKYSADARGDASVYRTDNQPPPRGGAGGAGSEDLRAAQQARIALGKARDNARQTYQIQLRSADSELNPTKKAARIADVEARFAKTQSEFEAKETEVTRRINALGKAPGLSDAASPSDAKGTPLPKSKDQLTIGTVYQSAKGPVRWTGTEFEAQ